LFGKSNNNSSNTSCIHFTYDETTRQLSLGHINAAFNCCPDSIYCQVSEDNDTITIEEFEGMGLCDCICLYDLDIRIEGMLPKMYYIKVVERSIDDDERLYFNVDLGLTPTGDYCVPRNSYPWGL